VAHLRLVETLSEIALDGAVCDFQCVKRDYSGLQMKR